MSRRFTDPKRLLGDLLDRYEAGAAAPIGYPDYSGFVSVNAADAFLKEIRLAEEVGAVRLAYGKGKQRDQIARVRLESPSSLYGHLGRSPIGAIAREAHASMIDGLDLRDGLGEAVAEIGLAWERGKTWGGFSIGDAEKLRAAVLLAQAVLEGRHAGLDYRTFSRRVSGDSKLLERVESAVVKLLTGSLDLPPDARPREALRTLGLEKFAPPLLMSGQLDLWGADMSCAWPTYLGISPTEADRVTFRKPPSYLLTIENYASFNRHIIEADPTKEGVTIYVGGYPSLATQKALKSLSDRLDEKVPFFHWSDIDPDGTWIFRTVEKAVGRRLRPHLMSVELAERFGKPASERADIRGCPADSGVAPLVEYLVRDGANLLEQEQLDPVRPSVATDVVAPASGDAV